MQENTALDLGQMLRQVNACVRGSLEARLCILEASQHQGKFHELGIRGHKQALFRLFVTQKLGVSMLEYHSAHKHRQP